MTAEKAEYAKVQIGPGGRYCSCCAPSAKYLKRYEHKAARRNERKFIALAIQESEEING